MCREEIKMEKMIPEEGDRILFVCINNSIDCPENGSIYDRGNDLKEATRKYWPVAKDKRDKITHVVSHKHGIVKLVLKDLSYTICREDNGCYGRLIFSGTEDENSPYIGKSMKHLVKHIQVTNYYNI